MASNPNGYIYSRPQPNNVMGNFNLPPLPKSQPPSHPQTPDPYVQNGANGGIKVQPLLCSGHTRPVVHLQFSNLLDDGTYLLISACKDGNPMLRSWLGDWIGTFLGELQSASCAEISAHIAQVTKAPCGHPRFPSTPPARSLAVQISRRALPSFSNVDSILTRPQENLGLQLWRSIAFIRA